MKEQQRLVNISITDNNDYNWVQWKMIRAVPLFTVYNKRTYKYMSSYKADGN